MKWLLILILLTGCTMRWDKTEIGGAEPGAVRFRFNGDPKLCQPYVYRGRVILGELKRQMQLGGIKNGQIDQTQPDGTKIHAQSNMYGLADIDEIWIEATATDVATAPTKASGADECLGYIVQGFAEQRAPIGDGSTPSYSFGGGEANWVQFTLRTVTDFTSANPTIDGDWIFIYPLNHITEYMSPYFDDVTPFTGFASNNAAYSPSMRTHPTTYSDYNESVYASEVDWPDPMYMPPAFVLPGHSYMYPIQMVKSTVDKGFTSTSGVKIGSDYQLSGISDTEGAGFLFMLPSKGEKQFYFAPEIVSFNAIFANQNTVGDVKFTGRFGIPITVEAGLHRIQTAPWQGSDTQISAKVHLLMKGSGMVVIDIPKDRLSLPNTDSPGRYNYKEIQIDIRALKSGETPASLVSMVDPTF